MSTMSYMIFFKTGIQLRNTCKDQGTWKLIIGCFLIIIFRNQMDWKMPSRNLLRVVHIDLKNTSLREHRALGSFELHQKFCR